MLRLMVACCMFHKPMSILAPRGVCTRSRRWRYLRVWLGVLSTCAQAATRSLPFKILPQTCLLSTQRLDRSDWKRVPGSTMRPAMKSTSLCWWRAPCLAAMQVSLESSWRWMVFFLFLVITFDSILLYQLFLWKRLTERNVGGPDAQLSTLFSACIIYQWITHCQINIWFCNMLLTMQWAITPPSWEAASTALLVSYVLYHGGFSFGQNGDLCLTLSVPNTTSAWCVCINLSWCSLLNVKAGNMIMLALFGSAAWLRQLVYASVVDSRPGLFSELPCKGLCTWSADGTCS